MKVRSILLLALAASAVSARAQQIAVGPSVEISADEPHATFGESWIAANPRNAKNLVAAAIRVGHSRWQAIPYWSMDGGKTWRRSTIPRDRSESDGDPMINFDADGVAYFSTTAFGENRDGAIFGTTLLRVSRDGGKTFGRATYIPTLTDRQWSVSDTTQSAFRGRFYIGGTGRMYGDDGKLSQANGHSALIVSWSDDKGALFPVSIVNSTSGFMRPGPGLLVGPEGHLIMTRLTWVRRDSLTVFGIGTRTSNDGGLSFGADVQGPEFHQGSSPAVGLDMSNGPHRGRLYLAIDDLDKRDATHVSVMLTYSDDFGKTWSGMRRVTDDSGRNAPINIGLAVNKDGVVGIAWNDRREDPTADCFRTYFTASLDGGETFLPNVTPTTKATCANDAANYAPSVWVTSFPQKVNDRWLPYSAFGVISSRFASGGDTQGLDSDADGVFHSAWVDGERGIMHLWHTSYRVPATRGGADVVRAAGPTGLASDSLAIESLLQLHTDEVQLDLAGHSVTTRLSLRNVSARSVAGPFTIVLDSVSSSLSDARPMNATCGGNSIPGASWVVGGEGATIARAGQSPGIPVRWTFTGGAPSERHGSVMSAYFSIREGNRC